MQIVTKVEYTSTDNLDTIIKTLNSLEKRYDILAMDFEACSKYSDEEKENMKTFLEENPETSREEKRQIKQFIESTGLSHPQLVHITHFQVAWNDHESFVAILPTNRHRKWVLRWLSKIQTKQIWHNASFDFKHILHHTKKIPSNFDDTAILAKTLLNHVNIFKAKVGLKELMGHKYGDWAIAADAFNISQIYDEDLLKYSATDPCATYALWEEIQETLKEES
jgi:DNA polymerase I-like protein with 3'-5' exonuclease and polymerase domains